MKAILERTPSFARKVYSEEERAYCEGKALPEVHFATRFAAKEAVVKALGTGFSEGIGVRDIEVRRTSKGKPYVVLSGRAKEVARRLGVRELPLSLSYTHTEAVACALAITEDSVRAAEERANPLEELARQFKEARSMLDEMEPSTPPATDAPAPAGGRGGCRGCAAGGGASAGGVGIGRCETAGCGWAPRAGGGAQHVRAGGTAGRAPARWARRRVCRRIPPILTEAKEACAWKTRASGKTPRWRRCCPCPTHRRTSTRGAGSWWWRAARSIPAPPALPPAPGSARGRATPRCSAPRRRWARCGRFAPLWSCARGRACPLPAFPPAPQAGRSPSWWARGSRPTTRRAGALRLQCWSAHRRGGGGWRGARRVGDARRPQSARAALRAGPSHGGDAARGRGRPLGPPAGPADG